MGIFRSTVQKYILLSKTSETSKYHLELDIVYISDRMSNMSLRSLENSKFITNTVYTDIQSHEMMNNSSASGEA